MSAMGIDTSKRSRSAILTLSALSLIWIIYLSGSRKEVVASLTALHSKVIFGQSVETQEIQKSSTGTGEVSLPSDYKTIPSSDYNCPNLYGLPYLENLRDSKRPFCEVGVSNSTLDCFRTNISGDRQDVFCVSESTSLRHTAIESAFEIDCKLRNPSRHADLKEFPEFGDFPKYMYDTGPGYIVNNFVDIGAGDEVLGDTENATDCSNSSERGYKILVKREGEVNPWHSLLEIFSLYLTLDILSMTPKTGRGYEPYYTSLRANNSQVVLLDDRDDGPFLELWELLTGQPTVRLADLASEPCEYNIIIPLPGGSNPLWHSDWSPQGCQSSILVSTFAKRLLTHYSIDTMPPTAENITVTIIERKETRRLNGLEGFTARLQQKYQDKDVLVQAVDFAAISVKEQLEVIRGTDVLVGVHGAGLVHTMFLPPGSAVVEIFPPELVYPVFRNLAKLSSMKYFSAHGQPATMKRRSVESTSLRFSGGEAIGGDLLKRDWHGEDLQMDEAAFLDIVDLAIRSMYNRGLLSIDAV